MYENNHVINNCLDPYVFNFENGKPTLKLGNIWILRYPKTEQHSIRFYCQGWKVCL